MTHPEEFYYTEGYDESVDPYVMENGVLVNLLGLSDTQSLNEIEADFSQLQIPKILLADLPEHFDTEYLRSLHRQIFSFVYPWAGEFRRVGIGKGDTIFLPHQQIQAALDELLTEIDQQKQNFIGDKAQFSQSVGDFLVRLNYIHPFREGNGRTQRLFVSKLAQYASIDLNWEAVSSEAMRRACIDGIEGNTRAMVRLILLNT